MFDLDAGAGVDPPLGDRCQYRSYHDIPGDLRSGSGDRLVEQVTDRLASSAAAARSRPRAGHPAPGSAKIDPTIAASGVISPASVAGVGVADTVLIDVLGALHIATPSTEKGVTASDAAVSGGGGGGGAAKEGMAHEFEAGKVIDVVAAVPARDVFRRAYAVAAVSRAQGGRGDPEFAGYCGDAQVWPGSSARRMVVQVQVQVQVDVQVEVEV